MRRAAFAALVAVLAVSARAVPADAEGWYWPERFSCQSYDAKWSQGGIEYACVVNADGTVEWSEKRPGSLAVEIAIENALAARFESTMLQDQIETLGKNLAALDWEKMLAEVKDTSSGATASGSIERQIDRFIVAADGLLSGGGMGPDGVSVVSNDAGRLALANLPKKDSGAGYLPYWTGTALDWTDIADLFDGKSIGVEADGGEGASAESHVSIKGWGSQGGCGERLSDMLTDPDKSDLRGKHEILCRFGGTKEGAIHYLPIGDAIRSGGAAIEVVGTSGSAVCTNRLTFASDENSDVRFVVTDEGNGNVKITVGVYYK